MNAPLLLAALLALAPPAALSHAADTNLDAAVISAVLGGVSITELHDGFQARATDGRITRWYRTPDGYSGQRDGSAVRLSRTRDGFTIQGAASGRVRINRDGFVVQASDGTSTRWNRNSAGFHALTTGGLVRLTSTVDGLRANRPATRPDPATARTVTNRTGGTVTRRMLTDAEAFDALRKK